MRTPRNVAVVVVTLIALSGCTATTALPEGPSDAELNERVRLELDKKWALTGLNGVVERPVIAVEEISSPDGFGQQITDCMADAGFTSWGAGPDGLDMTSMNPGGAATTPEQQLSYYECNARFPAIDRLSTQQLDFVYDYYRRWLIPCIQQQGYTVDGAPSRKEFYRSQSLLNQRWTPYGALHEPPTDGERYAALIAECTPTVAGIDGWSDRYELFGRRE